MLVLVLSLYVISPVLVVLLMAIVISSALDAPLNYLETKKVPRLLGILFIFIALFSIFILLLYTIIPIVGIEFKELFSNLDKVQAALVSVFGISSSVDFNFSNISITSLIFPASTSVFNIIPTVFENTVLAIATIVISFYLALYRDGIENFLRAVLPLAYEDYSISVFHRARKKIGKWLEGQIFLSFIIAIAVAAGLRILGVNYSLVLGLIAGLLEIIPFIGPLIAGFIAFLVAVSQSFVLGIYVVILFTIIQQLESHLLVPIVMRKTTGIHPVIVVLAILAGSQIGGFAGAILSIPIVVILQELVEDFGARKYRQQPL